MLTIRSDLGPRIQDLELLKPVISYGVSEYLFPLTRLGFQCNVSILGKMTFETSIMHSGLQQDAFVFIRQTAFLYRYGEILILQLITIAREELW